MEVEIKGQVIVTGSATGSALVTDEPLSFWGGYDYQTGEITDQRHPLFGEIATGRILVVPFSRGSSTTTAVLLEAVNAGTAPAAILTTSVDSFFALASIVADEMYALRFPVIKVDEKDITRFNSGDYLQIMEDGMIVIQDSGTA